MNRQTAAVVLAAGLGTRMKSDLPKVLHPLAGQAMIHHVLDAVQRINPERRVLVLSPTVHDAIAAAVPDAEIAIQDPPRGTGHAMMATRELLAGFDGDVLMTFGDTPLVHPETLEAMIAARRAQDNPAVVVLGFRPHDPFGYGRLVIGPSGSLERIVEEKDASAAERTIGLCNGGVMAIDGRRLFELLDGTDNANAKQEYYLTDIVAVAGAKGWTCAVVEGSSEEVMGINSRAQLAEAEAILQGRLRRRAMDEGATLLQPESVYFSHDTRLGRDVLVEPNVVFAPGVSVADGATVRGFCHLEGCSVGAGAIVGPFARLRPGTRIGAAARIGNFVEAKNAVVADGAKANHLSYLGDVEVGEKANIGAGTITCNYDGFLKHRTEIGAGAFIGSNTALVAPVRIGAGAIVGAGSTIAKDVDGDALALTRAPQQARAGFAIDFRQRKQAEKAKQRAKRKG